MAGLHFDATYNNEDVKQPKIFHFIKSQSQHHKQSKLLNKFPF